MIDKKKLLDEVVRREKRRKIRNFLVLASVVIVFGILFSYSVVKNYDRPKFSKEVSAMVESIDSTNNGKIISIRLPSEKIVSLAINHSKDISENQTVLVLQEELESGKMRYSLVDSAKK